MPKHDLDRFKLRPKEELYFAMEEADLSFTRAQVAKCILSWRNGSDIIEIAKEIEHTTDETAVLCIDLARKNQIQPRGRGVFGV